LLTNPDLRFLFEITNMHSLRQAHNQHLSM
jgi:hypothetical protein